ncbi:MAG: paraquat-inducible protein A, partial [Myxococcota bacterium]
WSMIDVFVVALMTSLVAFGSIASIEPGAGATCFAAVVVLTMLAVRSFEARCLWDAMEET